MFASKAINGAGMAVKKRGTMYTIARVMATNTYVSVLMPRKCGTCAMKIRIAMTILSPIRKSTSTVGKGMISIAMIITISVRISSSGLEVTLRKILSNMVYIP